MDLKESLLKDLEGEDIDAENWEQKIDEAADRIMASIDPDEIRDKVLTQLEGSGGGKAAMLMGLGDNPIRKDIGQMTEHEKVESFCKALLTGDIVTLKYLSESTSTTGGYLVPDEFSRFVVREMAEKPSVWNEVTKVEMKTDVMKIPAVIGRPLVFWKSEDAVKSTTTATFTEHTLTAHKCCSIIYSSDELIEDSPVDVVALVVTLFSEAMLEEFERVLTVGTSVGQPTGFASGGLGIQCQAVTGNLTWNDIIDLIYLLPTKYHGNAKFYVHPNNIRELRKIVDGQSRYIWLDAIAPKQPATIYGFAVIPNSHLPESEVYFGDLKRAVTTGVKGGMRVKVSNDNTQAFTRDQTAIRVVQRLASTVVLPSAIKCLNSIP